MVKPKKKKIRKALTRSPYNPAVIPMQFKTMVLIH